MMLSEQTAEMDPGVRATIPVALFAVMSYIMSSYFIHRYKRSTGKAPPLHETALTTLFGILGGGLIMVFTGKAVQFNNDLFFYLVLPPIIFSAGYNLKRKRFFKYSGYILLFGLLGTFMNFALIAGMAKAFNAIVMMSGLIPSDYTYELSWVEALLLSSVLSASDEVSALSLIRMSTHPRLGAIVFGEGIINSALSIVLFKTFLDLHQSGGSSVGIEGHLSVGRVMLEVAVQMGVSSFFGMSCGLICSRLFRVFRDLRLYPIHQTSLVMLWAYLAYAMAESFEYSGILSLFAASITLSHYAWHSLSKSSQLASRIAFVSVADMSEGFAFAYVGLSVWAYVYSSPESATNWLFTLYMLAVVVSSRFITIMLLCNMMRGLRCLSFVPFLRDMAHTRSLPAAEQRSLALGGLVRGCLCWAQVLQLVNIPGMQVMVSSTLMIVIITTVGCGICLPILIKLPSAASTHEGADTATVPLATPRSVHSSALAQGEAQGQKRAMTESTLNLWQALGLRKWGAAPGGEAGADDATAAGSSDDGSYTFGADDESSVNTDTLGGYASFRTSLQNVPEGAEAAGAGAGAASSSERSERAQIARDRREMERLGVSERLLSLPDVPGLLSTFDFLFRTRSGRGGSSQGYRLVPEQGQEEREGPRGSDRDMDKGRRDGDRDRLTIVTPSSRGPGKDQSGAVTMTPHSGSGSGNDKGGGGSSGSDEESTYSTHLDITPLDDDTDRASQPSTSPFHHPPQEWGPPQRGSNHIPPPSGEAAPRQGQGQGLGPGRASRSGGGRYGSFNSVASTSTMGTMRTNPYPTPPKRPPGTGHAYQTPQSASTRAPLRARVTPSSLQPDRQQRGRERGRADAPFLYKLWVFVDTVYMKPTFGGSRADPGSAAEGTKHQYITDVRSSFILSPTSAAAARSGQRQSFRLSPYEGGGAASSERGGGVDSTGTGMGWRRSRSYVPIPDLDEEIEAGGLGLVTTEDSETPAASPMPMPIGGGGGGGGLMQHLGPEVEGAAIDYMMEHSPDEQGRHPFMLSQSAPSFPSTAVSPSDSYSRMRRSFREEDSAAFGDEKRYELEDEISVVDEPEEPDDAHRLKDIVASPDGPFVIPGEDFVFEEETPPTTYGDNAEDNL